MVAGGSGGAKRGRAGDRLDEYNKLAGKGKVAVDEPNHPDNLLLVIADAHHKIQFSSNYHSLEKQHENLQARYAELESKFARVNKELDDKNVTILEIDNLKVQLRKAEEGFFGFPQFDLEPELGSMPVDFDYFSGVE